MADRYRLRSQTPKLLSLPTEILMRILELLSPEVLARLLLKSRELGSTAISLLYRSDEVPGLERRVKFWITIVKSVREKTSYEYSMYIKSANLVSFEGTLKYETREGVRDGATIKILLFKLYKLLSPSRKAPSKLNIENLISKLAAAVIPASNLSNLSIGYNHIHPSRERYATSWRLKTLSLDVDNSSVQQIHWLKDCSTLESLELSCERGLQMPDDILRFEETFATWSKVSNVRCFTIKGCLPALLIARSILPQAECKLSTLRIKLDCIYPTFSMPEPPSSGCNTSVRALELEFLKPHVQMLSFAVDCENIESLVLRNSGYAIDDTFLLPLSRFQDCASIQRLILDHIPPGDSLMLPLLQKLQLQHLELTLDEYLDISDARSYHALSHLKGLKSLKLVRARPSPETIDSLVDSLSVSLEHLELCTEVDGEAIRSIASKCLNLATLSVVALHLCDAVLGPLASLSRLKCLTLEGSSNFSLHGLQRFIMQLKPSNYGLFIGIDGADLTNSLSLEEKMKLQQQLASAVQGALQYSTQSFTNFRELEERRDQEKTRLNLTINAMFATWLSICELHSIFAPIPLISDDVYDDVDIDYKFLAEWVHKYNYFCQRVNDSRQPSKDIIALIPSHSLLMTIKNSFDSQYVRLFDARKRLGCDQPDYASLTIGELRANIKRLEPEFDRSNVLGRY